MFPSRNNQYKDKIHINPRTILPTSPKNIFAGFQFQYKKAEQVDIIKISNIGKYSDLFKKCARIIPVQIVMAIRGLIPSIPSIKLKILTNQVNIRIKKKI